MIFAYLILAHKNLKQLQRLVKNLLSETAFVFIHIDKKAGESPFVELLSTYKNIFFCKRRISVNWGGFSMVEATVSLMETMIKNTGIPDYVHLLSGGDFPLKNTVQIEDFFNRNYGCNFIKFESLPKSDWNSGGIDRIEYDWHIDSLGYERSMEMIKYQKPKKFIPGIIPYGSSQWWSLTGECVYWLFEQCRAGNEIYEFYKHTIFSDEMFFHSLLLNSHFKETVINTNLRKIDWTAKRSHPRTWLSNDIELLIKAPKLFARKFDEEIDAEVLDSLEFFISQAHTKEKDAPEISVVMALCNSEKYLKECIESVLNQTFNDFEFIIVDYGSDDSSLKIVESFNDSRIRLINNKRDYIDSLNKGMSAARGEYIARMDSCDIMQLDRLETQYDFMISNPHIDVCGTWAECFEKNAKTLKRPTEHNEIVSKLLVENPIINSSGFIKNKSLKRNSISYKNYIDEDYKFWIDCAEAGLIFSIIPKVLIKKRTTGKNDEKSYKIDGEIMKSTDELISEYAQFIAEFIVEKEKKYSDLIDILIDSVNKSIIDTQLFLKVLSNIYLKLLK